MNKETRKIIDGEILPVIQSQRAVLFLGAGFSQGTPTINGATVPSTPELIQRILIETGNEKVDFEKVDLQTAFSVGEDEIIDFRKFLENNFLCKDVFDWQVIPFCHWWRRIFTTNIDSAIEECANKAAKYRENGPEFAFFNYRDRTPAISNPLRPPIVYLHGSIRKFADGFVFDRVAYADHTVKSGDWLRDAAYHLSYGHCIIVGSKLNETDLEAEIRKRIIWEKKDDDSGKLSSYPNYIILNEFNEIEKKGYLKRGIIPIETSSEDFFNYLSRKLTLISQAKLLKRLAPHLRIEHSESDSIAWFSESFTHIGTVCGKAKTQRGILSRFFTGDFPDWYYIVNTVPAKFDYFETIIGKIRSFLSDENPLLSITITGPIASGKTTLSRIVLHELSKTIEAVYEYTSYEGIDIEYAWRSIKNIKGIIIIFFDKSSEYFYAINELGKRLLNSPPDGKVLFLLEEREIPYSRNEHHLYSLSDYIFNFNIPPLSESNSGLLFFSLKEVGMLGGKLSGKSEFSSKKIICDTERGYRGDLLATLCDVTSRKSFQSQLADEYNDIDTEDARNIFKTLSLVTSARLSLPITYISEIFNMGHYAIISILKDQLKGKVYIHDNKLNVSTRHYVIADYHVKELFSNEEKEKQIIGLMECVSKKFQISEIKKHPLPYRIYKSILHHMFLKHVVFEDDPQRIESVYSQCQKLFAGDGIFWIQYGRFLYHRSRYLDAEHCFRIGLEIYDSFQIRHSLGQVLLKLYCVHDFCEPERCDEGIALLTREIDERGEFDPYPYTTLGNGLLDILEKDGNNDDLQDILRLHCNNGLTYHKRDQGFMRMISRGIKLGFLGVNK